ncbi:XRE family transcriptional regulator [Staphylococcus intermedius]|uniref:Zn peptidase with DNA binding domain n=1 Tax=Staphylococcus intermedius NCTC 11048 TaxID=1141106 RepID=A0A380G485_STAIN|nr:XRE family transcriptional regulator [Staphylococcus intermedius]PCF64116.1 zinc peptidase [Staphylococcus intermedius]PCF78831.1 zinc peptidase [Staphylococcus intermedius]PCF79804.1 zinc peptidase [Staphylococcus intermedius]PCF85015.1 zinc peptidase [Staphylococcus intermedius]PCF89537.1 zinc peptidase [Staphylococcus intermedius]
MFKGENLKALRMIEGYSRKSLADVLQVSEQAVWQYEVQNMMPEINKIYTLAQQFNVKTKFFFSAKQDLFTQTAVDTHSIAFRSKNQRTSTKILSQNHAQANFYAQLTDYLSGYVKQPHPPILTLIHKIDRYLSQNMDARARIQLIANEAREMVLNHQSNDQLLLALEKFGIYIYEKDLTDDADAYSFWSKHQVPFIILSNNKGVAVRRHFDLAHELGHLLLHRQVEFDMLTHEAFQTIEKEADIFAAEFLLPEKQFIESFHQVKKKSNPDHFVMLKEQWHVSIQAMAMRAFYLGLLSDTQYRYFWSLINKKGYKKREPLDVDIQLPKPVKINSLLNMLFSKKVLTPESLLDDLQLEPEFLYKKASISQKLFEKFMQQEKRTAEADVLNGFVIPFT